MKRRHQVVLGCLWMLVLGFAVFSVWLIVRVIPKSAARVNDADLRPVRPLLSPQDNALTHLTNAAALLRWPTNEHRKLSDALTWKAWDEELISGLLAEHVDALALVRQAARSKAMVWSVSTSFVDDDPDNLTAIRRLGQLLALQAIAEFRHNEPTNAFDTSFDLLTIGHLAEDASGDLYHYSVASALKQISFSQFRQLASRAEFPPDKLVTMAQRLNGYGPHLAGISNTYRVEYQRQVRGLGDIQSGKVMDPHTTNSPLEQAVHSLGIGFVLNVERSKGMLAEHARLCQSAIPQRYSEMPLNRIESRSTNNSPFQLLLKGNAIGTVLVGMTTGSSGSFLRRKSTDSVTVAATRTVLALRAYQLRHGTLPESLDALVPDFLSAVPVDDFDGKPLRYSREKLKLWSVGKDLVDSGGEEMDRAKNPLDQVFSIEFVPVPSKR